MTQFTHGYALIIGVGKTSNYAKWSLPITVHDAQAIAQLLGDPSLCAYPQNENHIRVLCNEDATTEKILEGIAWLHKQVKDDANSTAVVYFSGHGWVETASQQYFLITNDVEPFDVMGTALPAKIFSDRLLALPTQRLLIMIDSCHAQGMAQAKDGSPEVKLPPQYSKSPAPPDLINQLGQGKGVAVFSSCKGEEQSYIAPGAKNSLFTQHMLEAFQGMGSKEGETAVKISTLMGYLSNMVPASAQAINRTQTPVFKMENEDFSVAMLLGGKGLAGQAQPPIDRSPSSPSPRNHFEANLSGSGTIQQAEGNATTASGSGIAIGGNVGGGVQIIQGGQTINNYQGKPPHEPSDPTRPKDPYNLREKMLRYLSRTEIQTVIYDLGIEINLLSGNSLQEKVIETIDYCQKRNRLEELIKLCEGENKYVNWRQP